MAAINHEFTFDLKARLARKPRCRRVFTGCWWKPWTWHRGYWEVTFDFECEARQSEKEPLKAVP